MNSFLRGLFSHMTDQELVNYHVENVVACSDPVLEGILKWSCEINAYWAWKEIEIRGYCNVQ